MDLERGADAGSLQRGAARSMRHTGKTGRVSFVTECLTERARSLRPNRNLVLEGRWR